MQNVHLTQAVHTEWVLVDCRSWKIINFRVVTRTLFYVAPDRTALSVIFFFLFVRQHLTQSRECLHQAI